MKRNDVNLVKVANIISYLRWKKQEKQSYYNACPSVRFDGYVAGGGLCFSSLEMNQINPFVNFVMLDGLFQTIYTRVLFMVWERIEEIYCVGVAELKIEIKFSNILCTLLSCIQY